MSDPILKIQILARAEMALMRMQAQRVAVRLAFAVVATVFGLLGLGMFNLAGFHALSEGHGPAVAALFVALVDTAVAVGVLLAARTAGPKESDERLAREIRDLASREIDRDVKQLEAEFEQIGADVRKIRSTVSSFSSTLTSTLGPLLSLLGIGKR
jgi:hypothetical protein